jgi:hypothetical protein
MVRWRKDKKMIAGRDREAKDLGKRNKEQDGGTGGQAR